VSKGEYHILNLGAGVQSTALYLMSLRRDEPEHVPVFDYAIFADTGEEPKAVRKHLDWLHSLGGPPIIERSVGSRLGDDLARGIHSTGQRFASIPAFTKDPAERGPAMLRRQCTAEYKIGVVERAIRRDVLGLEPGRRVPKGVAVHQWFGLSYDEPRRIVKVQDRFRSIAYAEPHFPLWDMQYTRADCAAYLAAIVPHETPRSACTFCPFHDNAEWRRLRDSDPEGWSRAVEVDAMLRRPGAVVNRGLDAPIFVHRSCVPLSEAPIDEPETRSDQYLFGFAQECEGMCGN
jgi:hypothetical protein